MGSGRALLAVVVVCGAVSASAQSAVETGFLDGDVAAWVIHPKDVSVYKSNDHLGGVIFSLTEEGLDKAKADAKFQVIVSHLKATMRANPQIWIPTDYPGFDTITEGLLAGQAFKFSVGSRVDYQNERLIVTRIQVTAREGRCPGGGTWESGVIMAERPKPQPPPHSLTGPFLLLSLSNAVNPAKPTRQFVILNDPTGHPAIGNEWLDVDAFRGPLFLGKGAAITGRADFTPSNVVYSGCRL